MYPAAGRADRSDQPARSREPPRGGTGLARLRRANCAAPGYTRKRRGRGFQYFDVEGAKITDPEVLQRIADLAIPPAWREVWISPDPLGHLQAVGTDDRGRKQYRYHDAWRQRRDRLKFEHMVQFAQCLPALREHCGRALASSDQLTRERVLACAVRLLDHGFFRIGGETYAAENDTVGLATMRKEHVSLSDDGVAFDYPAKGGKRRVVSVVDPDVFEVVAALKRRRSGGSELLAYRQGRGWTDLRSDDVNTYIKSLCGPDCSAKDFRTWNATVLAAVALAVSAPAAKGKTSAKRAMTRAAKEVSGYLGNTPAVARSAYIDPRVFDRYLSGWTIAGALAELGADEDAPPIQGPIEEAVLDLLAHRRDSPAVQRGDHLDAPADA